VACLKVVELPGIDWDFQMGKNRSQLNNFYEKQQNGKNLQATMPHANEWKISRSCPNTVAGSDKNSRSAFEGLAVI